MQYPSYVSPELKNYVKSASIEACRNAGVLSRCDDLEQECIIALHQIQPLVDVKNKGAVAFQKKAIQFKILDFLKSGRRLKSTQLVYSLDETAGNDASPDGGSNVDLVEGGQPDYSRKRDLAIDVTSILGRLPRKHFNACMCLIHGMDKQEIPSAIGVSEYRFRKVMIPELRRAFKCLKEEV